MKVLLILFVLDTVIWYFSRNYCENCMRFLDFKNFAIADKILTISAILQVILGLIIIIKLILMI